MKKDLHGEFLSSVSPSTSRWTWLRLCHCSLCSSCVPADLVYAMNVCCSKLTFSNISLFPLILCLCLALNPNNQYNFSPFCSISATLLMQRKPQLYWLQELQDWILDPIETNDKTRIDFSGSRIGSLMLAICLSQRATRSEGHQQICWQEYRSAPQNSKAKFTCGGSSLHSGFTICVLGCLCILSGRIKPVLLGAFKWAHL